MPASILIEGKTIGKSRPLFDDWFLPLPPELEPSGGKMTLRGLITRIVNEEVAAFRERQVSRKIVRALTEKDIQQGLARGKVDMGGRDLEQEVNADNALGSALQSFEDGIYYVFVDEIQRTDLEEEIYLKPDSKVTFIRLVALVGG